MDTKTFVTALLKFIGGQFPEFAVIIGGASGPYLDRLPADKMTAEYRAKILAILRYANTLVEEAEADGD